jgi:hypothetical protein
MVLGDADPIKPELLDIPDPVDHALMPVCGSQAPGGTGHSAVTLGGSG